DGQHPSIRGEGQLPFRDVPTPRCRSQSQSLEQTGKRFSRFESIMAGPAAGSHPRQFSRLTERPTGTHGEQPALTVTVLDDDRVGIDQPERRKRLSVRMEQVFEAPIVGFLRTDESDMLATDGVRPPGDAEGLPRNVLYVRGE